MRGIDADFEHLQPIAVDMALEGEGIGIGREEAVEIGKSRRLALAEIGENDPAALDRGMGAEPDAPTEIRIGLRRRFEAVAVHVEEPAVEDAAKAAILGTTVSEIGATMRAMAVEQTKPPRFIAEEDEI